MVDELLMKAGVARYSLLPSPWSQFLWLEFSDEGTGEDAPGVDEVGVSKTLFRKAEGDFGATEDHGFGTLGC